MFADPFDGLASIPSGNFNSSFDDINRLNLEDRMIEKEGTMF